LHLFTVKLSIVIEEVDECEFWLEFALDEKIISGEIATVLMNEAKELTAIFISSRKTIQSRNNK
jgi:four helix bundle protein